MRARLGMMQVTASALIASAIAIGGCGKDDQDPAGASALRQTIDQGAGFRSWARAPGYPGREPSFTAHARYVDIYVSKEVSDAFTSGAGIHEWPQNSIIVKESFGENGKRVFLAAMQKRADGWLWVEWSDSGDVLNSGKPALCTDCHQHREKYSDWVYAFPFPR